MNSCIIVNAGRISLTITERDNNLGWCITSNDRVKKGMRKNPI